MIKNYTIFIPVEKDYIGNKHKLFRNLHIFDHKQRNPDNEDKQPASVLWRYLPFNRGSRIKLKRYVNRIKKAMQNTIVMQLYNQSCSVHPIFLWDWKLINSSESYKQRKGILCCSTKEMDGTTRRQASKGLKDIGYTPTRNTTIKINMGFIKCISYPIQISNDSNIHCCWGMGYQYF